MHGRGKSDSSRTMRKRMQLKLAEVKQELRRRMHQPIREQGVYLRSVVRGYFRYHGVPMNGSALDVFRRAVIRLWLRILRRRSQKRRITAQRMEDLARLFLPPARICHPYPWVRIAL